MKRPNKRQSTLGERTIFDNTADKQFNPWKDFYAIVEVDGVSKVYRHRDKFRSSAIRHFESEARRDGGVVQLISVVK